ncbi:SDR family oxidoreductase [Nocardioides nanhaiensis]|uniref:SDR family NAD(P)-dependent oxidoreductase n=1 Tax=Nocardioides nanhaiensis TaxID=1476871 RepID=A0ABP8VUY0_9ACTN
MTTLSADVGDDGQVRAMVREVVSTHGRLDVVVSAAGVVAYGRTEEVPVEVFDGVLRTNLLGSANLARHVVPQLRAQRSGTLLLVGSVIGHVAVPTMSAYVVSKWGVRALARQLRIENRDLPGVRVLYVAPGGVDTPIYDQAANYAGLAGRPPPPAVSAARTARQVLRRVEGARAPEQLSLLNHGLVAAFQWLPRLYDALVGAVFPLGATDLRRPVPPGPGNVLTPRPEVDAEDGHHGSSVLGVLGNLVASRRGPRRDRGGDAGG